MRVSAAGPVTGVRTEGPAPAHEATWPNKPPKVLRNHFKVTPFLFQEEKCNTQLMSDIKRQLVANLTLNTVHLLFRFFNTTNDL